MNKSKFDIIKNSFKSRGGKYLFTLSVLILFYSVVFDFLYSHFENKEIDFVRSLEFIVESMTTTGYGGLLPFYSSILNIFVIIVMITGVVMIFMIIPLFLVPWIQAKMKTDTPKKASDELKDHVIICGYFDAVNFLVEELVLNAIPCIVIEKNRERCFELIERGIMCIQGDPSTAEALKNSGIESAHAIIVASRDEENAIIILTARQLSDVPIIAIVENPDNAKYLEYAGAAKVTSPKHELAKRMAYKTAYPVINEISKALHIPKNLHIAEVAVHKDSAIAGKSLAEAAIGTQSGAKVIGMFNNGKFTAELHRSSRLEPSSIILAIGTENEIGELKQISSSESLKSSESSSDVVLIGFGHVGQEIYKYFSHMDDCIAVVDRKKLEIKNSFSGNASDDSVLIKAGIEDASIVLICLNDDTQAIYSTLLARKLNPEAYLVARCNMLTSIDKFYKAGANHVFALPMITGIMLASLITGKGKLEFEKLSVERFSVRSANLAGMELKDTGIREKAGCTVIGIEKDDIVLLDLRPDLKLSEDEILVIVGTEKSLKRFSDEFKITPLP